MSEPPPAPTFLPVHVSDATGDEGPGDATPRLLVMPSADVAPPSSIVWPGPEGQPGWAIPVMIPPGTRGYALFIPLVQATATQAKVETITQPAPAPVANTQPSVTAPAPVPDTQASATPTAPVANTEAPVAAPAPATDEQAPPVPVPAVVSGDKTPAVAGSSSTQVRSPEASPTPVPSAAPSGTATTPPAVTAPPAATTPPAVTAPPSGTTTPAVGQPGTTPQPSPQPRTTPQPRPQPSTTVPSRPHPSTTPHPSWTGIPGHAPAAPFHGFPHTPAPPAFLETRWPGPAPARGWAVPAAVLTGALGLAFFVPLSRTGIGWLLGWLILTIGVVVAVRQPAAELPRAERWTRAGWAAAALALLSVLAFRNAWWLVTFCVLGALGCAALAIIGGRFVRSILFSLVAAPFAAFRGLPWIRRHLQASEKAGMTRRITGSVAATVVVLIVFGALLSSADVAFSAALGAIVPAINASTVFRMLFLLAVGGLITVAAVYTLSAPPDLSTVDKPSRRSLGIVEWAPPIAGLTLLFGGFVAVQFTVLFGGQRHVLRTTGLSYAEYARSGFWQLLAVTLLTLAVLAGVTRWARRDRPAERVLLRTLLGLLSALSIVIVVSALSRMYTYQQVYSFTGERIFVMALELALGVVFLMIMAAGIRWRGAWIPRLTVGLAVAMLLGLAVLNPEDYAAQRNISRYQATGKIDAWYLRALSADATPALAGLPDPVRRCTLSWIADELAEPDPWYAWNLGRARAREALDRLGPSAIGGPRDCRAADQFDLPKSRSQPR